MKVTREDFTRAAAEGLITVEQAGALWESLSVRDEGRARFDLAHVAYYVGALVVISGMGWFMTLGWEAFGGWGIFAISALYALCFALAGRTLWFKERLHVPGGLLFTLAVWMTPLALYGLQRALGLWPQEAPENFRGYHVWVKGCWLVMELGTIVAGLVALRYVRFPFLTFPIAFTLWYMSMDLTPLLFGQDEFAWGQRLWVSLVFGLLMLVASFLVDRRAREDYAFWGYLFGMLAFWFGLSLMESSSELNKFLYFLINAGLILVSVLLDRRVFIVFGALGVTWYLGYLSSRVFEDSMLFPVVLSFIGIAIIYLGIQYQRHRERVTRFVHGLVPASVRQLLPQPRG